MTVTQTDDPAVPEAQLEAFAESVLGAALGCAEVTVMHLGRTLGLYVALRGEEGLSAAKLATRAGVDERYAREWLEHQAVAGVLTVEDPSRPAAERAYALPEAHAVALLDEEHPAYVGALADIPPIIGRTLEQVAGAFRTGAGVPFADYGLHDMQAGFTRPMFANSLVAEWLPLLPDVQARLEAGEPLRIADVGCGEGWRRCTWPRPTRTWWSTGSTSTTRPSPPPGATPPTAVWPSASTSRSATSRTRASTGATTWPTPAR